ncbi:MAG: response regulator transcription factor [Desulfobulbaceae bacterium]|nr:response regulator transcription factor [Desulfobulbaceae bacterium]
MQIYLFGGNNNSRCQHELAAYFLKKELDATCTLASNPAAMANCLKEENAGQRLLLFDCLGMNRLECLEIYQHLESIPGDHAIVALMNIAPEEETDKDALQQGARGVFYTTDSLASLKKGIMALAAGEMWFPRKVLNDYFLEKVPLDNKTTPSKEEGLTAREKEILSLIAVGASNTKIAEKLHISPSTAKTHTYNIFKKINTPNRLQAAMWAIKNL